MSMSFINESTLNTSVSSPERPIYTIEDLGIPTHASTQQTIIGRTRSLSSLSKYEWSYLIISFISLLIGSCLTIERLFNQKLGTSDSTFACLLLWTTLFCYIYVYQGVLRERAYELAVFVATTLIVIIYVIINFCTSTHNTVKTIRLSLTCAICPVLLIGGVLLSRKYYRSKNFIYRIVGANIEMQSLCERLFLASSLLKFDVQLGGSALILWLKKGFLYWTETEGFVVGFGSGITAVWMAMGFIAMRFENKTLVYVFIATSVFEPSIIIWNLIRYKLQYNSDEDVALIYSVYTAGIIAIIVRIATVIVMYIVMLNFGKGLKQKVYGDINGHNRLREGSSQPIND